MLVLHSTLARLQDPEVYASELARLEPSERARILRKTRPDDRKAALLGRVLLREGLSRLGLDPGLADRVCYTRFGKPFVSPGVHFNISHSGQRVVCALSRSLRVGIDLEAERDIPFEDFQEIMTEGQWLDIRSAASPSRRFLEYWTMKEGVVKARGEGLGLPLDAISGVGPCLALDGETWHSRPLALADGYVCHLTAKVPVSALRIEAL